MKTKSLIAPAAGLFLAACAHVAFAANEIGNSLRIIDVDPYDQITLTEAQGGGTFKVKPLPLPDRRLPAQPDPAAKLTVELIDGAGTKAEIAWRDIARVELFEQMVLSAAEQLAAGKEFEQAYDYLAFLHERYPHTAGLAEASQDLVYRNAGAHFERGEHAEALALLEELHRQNPTRPGVAAALTSVSEKMFAGFIAAQQFSQARRLLQRTLDRGGADDQAAVWKDRLQQMAAAHLQAAKGHLVKEDFSFAHDEIHRALFVWPEAAGAKELRAELNRRYPVIEVAVPQRTDWSIAPRRLQAVHRRRQALVARPLVALAGFNADGPIHISPWGKLSVAADRRGVTVELKDENAAATEDGLTAYDVAQWLAATGRPNATQGQPAQGQPAPPSLIRSVDVDRVYAARIRLRRPHVSPLTLLADMACDEQERAASKRWSGEFESASADGIWRFTRRASGIAAPDGAPREIVERFSADPLADVQALREGRVDVVARVAPELVPQLINDEQITIGQYAVPSVHLLIPNLQRPFPRSRTFRRAVSYAIDRERILRDDILSGTQLKGCRTISGPFPTSEKADDFWGHAYDARIAPLPYEPPLALTLKRVATDELARAADNSGRPAPELTTLVIGHQDDWLHRRAAQAIAASLSRAGFRCETRQVETPDDAQTCDFLYAEIVMTEPIVDIARLLAHRNLAADSRYLTLALRRLQSATNWPDATAQLHRIHAMIHAEQTVVPLWQLADHFAYRNSVAGISDNPITLYDNVQDWRIASADRPDE